MSIKHLCEIPIESPPVAREFFISHQYLAPSQAAGVLNTGGI